MEYVWIDCDTGADDALAFMLLLQAHERGEVKIAGVSCVSGNTSLSNATMNNLRLLKLYGQLDDIPIYAGCSKGLITVKPLDQAENIHGSDGMGGRADYNPAASIDLLKYVKEEHAATAIIAASKTYGKQLRIIATGPLTNVATAVTLDPQLPSRIQAMYIMGGTSRGHGNITPDAEFNFYRDPHAAFITLQHFPSKCDTHIVEWELLLDNALQLDWYENWMSNVSTRRKDFLKMALTPLYDFSLNEGEPGADGNAIIIADPCCMAIMLHPEIGLNPRQVTMTVELGGSATAGSCVVKDYNKNEVSETCSGPITMYTGFDLENYKAYLANEFPQ